MANMGNRNTAKRVKEILELLNSGSVAEATDKLTVLYDDLNDFCNRRTEQTIKSRQSDPYKQRIHTLENILWYKRRNNKPQEEIEEVQKEIDKLRNKKNRIKMHKIALAEVEEELREEGKIC